MMNPPVRDVFKAFFPVLSFLLLVGTAHAVDFDVTLPPLIDPEIIYWIDPDGDDSADGSKDAPFATFQRGVDAVREARLTYPGKSVAVYFNAGDYPVDETTVLNEISGTPESPVLFRSAPGMSGKVRFLGRSRIDAWERLEGSDFWRDAPPAVKSRVRPEVVDKIWTADYRSYRSDHYAPDLLGKRQEFFVDGEPQTLARWPNDRFALSGKALGPTPITSWGPDGTAEGIFEADPEQPSGWNNEPDAILFGYWFWDWCESFERFESIDDPETTDATDAIGDSSPNLVPMKTIRMRSPYHEYGYRHHLRYYGFNLLCELDAPGEFFIDRALDRIFWIPPEGVDPVTSETTLSTFEGEWVVRIKNCRDLVLAGLSFDGGFGGALILEDCESVRLADLTVSRFSGNVAVRILGGGDCGVYHSRLETLGAGGFHLTGGDRKTLTDSRFFIAETVVHRFSRIRRTYAPAILAEGCGMKFTHNDISDSSSSAIRLEGNEMIVEFSRFSDLVKESDDQGGIDICANPTYRGNLFRYNRWENIVGGSICGAAAIRFDDMISGQVAYGNLFVHCGDVNFGAIQIHGGKDNLVENNVALDCRAMVSFQPWGDLYVQSLSDPKSLRYGGLKNACHRDVEIDSSLWRERYPELGNLLENVDRNFTRNNLMVNCRGDFIRSGDSSTFENNIFENNHVENLPDATEEEVTDPEFLARFGLKPIPVDQFGVKAPPYLPE